VPERHRRWDSPVVTLGRRPATDVIAASKLMSSLLQVQAVQIDLGDDVTDEEACEHVPIHDQAASAVMYSLVERLAFASPTDADLG
jgi:hypothetical protein